MAAGFTFTSTTSKTSIGLTGFSPVQKAAAELKVSVHWYMAASPVTQPAAAPMGANQKGQCDSCLLHAVPCYINPARSSPKTAD